MSDVGAEVLERMIALVKRASNTFADERHHGEWLSIALEADRIVALLPKPVAPLLEKVTVSIRGRGQHDVSLGELSRLISGGARITDIRARAAENSHG